MSSTNEVSALNRMQKFSNINLISTNVYKILELTKGSFYRIFIQETEKTTIFEIINSAIYTICTPEAKQYKLENDILYISGFGTCDIIIEFYEEFKFEVIEVTEELEVPLNTKNTNGVVEYLVEFRAQKFIANEVSVNTIKPTSITCSEILIGDWMLSSINGNVTIGLQPTPPTTEHEQPEENQ